MRKYLPYFIFLFVLGFIAFTQEQAKGRAEINVNLKGNTTFNGTSADVWTPNVSPNHIANRGLLGHWTFDGMNVNWGLGSVFDVSGNNQTGTITAMDRLNGAIPGIHGQAFRFNGANQFISGPSSAGLRPASTSISAWVSPMAVTAAAGAIVSNRASNAVFGGYLLSYDNANNDKLNILITNNCTSWGTNFVSNNTLQIGKWYHVVVTYKSGEGLMYVDGVRQTLSSTMTGNICYGTDNLRIGGESNGTRFNGRIDDVRLYNYPLTPQEVQLLYEAGR